MSTSLVLNSSVLNLSYPLSESTPTFNNGPKIEILKSGDITCGHSSNSFFIRFHNHSGTHLDLPRHFDQNGKSLSDYSLSEFIFLSPFCVELSLSPNELISASHLNNIQAPRETDLLLFKTGFSQFRGKDEYWRNNPGFAPECAQAIRARFPRCRCIGFDFISLTALSHRETGREAHRAFLANTDRPIWIIEDMNLAQIDSATSLQQVIVSPLLVQDADGIPVTVWGFGRD